MLTSHLQIWCEICRKETFSSGRSPSWLTTLLQGDICWESRRHKNNSVQYKEKGHQNLILDFYRTNLSLLVRYDTCVFLIYVFMSWLLMCLFLFLTSVFLSFNWEFCAFLFGFFEMFETNYLQFIWRNLDTFRLYQGSFQTLFRHSCMHATEWNIRYLSNTFPTVCR